MTVVAQRLLVFRSMSEADARFPKSRRQSGDLVLTPRVLHLGLPGRHLSEAHLFCSIDAPDRDGIRACLMFTQGRLVDPGDDGLLMGDAS